MPRPRTYDSAQLLETAMEAFWAKGYERTSIDDLVRHTGVNRASLYCAYPDKRALFVAGIRHYLETVTEDNIRRLRSGRPAARAVRQFFTTLIEAPAQRARKGCLLTNSAVEFGVSDEEVRRLIRAALRRVEQALRERLEEARAEGDLAGDVEPRALARLLVTLLQGVRVMLKSGVERAIVRDALLTALKPLGTSRRIREDSGHRGKG
ncbi:MAG: TetR/AcrR family transcriptional regulator [Burkholderiales bacterium]